MFNNIFQNKKVLVTGNTGFKGSWLTAWLLQLGANITGVSNDIPTKQSHYNYLKINKGVQKTLFRSALKGITPQNTLKKIRKTGWNAPAHLWISSKYTNLLNDIFSSRDFRESGLYNTKKIRQLYENHNKIIKNGHVRENHMMFFWQLASINIWKNSIKINVKPLSILCVI